jgi:hypothetical protein
MNDVLSLIRARTECLCVCGWLGLVLGGAACQEAKGAVLRVDARGLAAEPDGLTWETAFSRVQTALDASSLGDEIWVAAGVYVETLELPAGRVVLGGFAGTESAAGERDWRKRLTVLDGGRLGTVVTVQAGADSSTRVDGLVIRNGFAYSGGGVRCVGAAPVLENNLIQGNAASIRGGGIYISGASPLILNNRIVGNLVDGVSGHGGGLNCDSGAAPVIRGNLILGNSLGWSSLWFAGGGIWVGPDCAAVIENNTIVWNDAARGGGVYSASAGVRMANNLVAYGTSGVHGVPGMEFRFNCLFGHATNALTGMGPVMGRDGNFSADPRVRSITDHPDPRLREDSPCRGVGDASVVEAGASDLDGRARLAGGLVDVGAYAYTEGLEPEDPIVVRVSVDGDDARDGSTWSAAMRTVQAAIDRVELTGGEVWVAAGEYRERIVLRHFVRVYGGFRGEETERGQRDWRQGVTALDGDRGGTVVTARYLQHWAVIDGFTIRNGLAARGGGIRCEGASPLIANNRITGNETLLDTVPAGTPSGGGILCVTASPRIVGNEIVGNVGDSGGGLAAARGSSPWVANNVIASNTALYVSQSGIGNLGGGGLYLAGGRPVVLNNHVAGNVATNRGGTISVTAAGGGIHVSTGTLARVFGNTIVRNQASTTWFGDQGGGLFCASEVAHIANNVVAHNSGGVKASSTTVGNRFRFQHNCVYGNSSADFLGMTDPTGVLGNLGSDPRLAEPELRRLQEDSPCVDAGLMGVMDPAWLDSDGEPRCQGESVDIGCDERPALPVWARHEPAPGDVEVTLIERGGIWYARVVVLLRDGCRRKWDYEALVRQGDRLGIDLRLAQTTGVACPDILTEAEYWVVAGPLPEGSYHFEVESWGEWSERFSFVAHPASGPTLTGPWAVGDRLGFEILGLAPIDYVVLSSSDWVNWMISGTNHGGGWYETGWDPGEATRRFFRVRVEPWRAE